MDLSKISVAPIGWPFNSRPPEGLIGTRPPIVNSPRSAEGPPSPSGANIEDTGVRRDLSESGRIVHFRHVDVARPDAGPFVSLLRGKVGNVLMRLVLGARDARLNDAGEKPDGAPSRPITRFSPSALHNTAAAAPSLMGEHIGSVSG